MLEYKGAAHVYVLLVQCPPGGFWSDNLLSLTGRLMAVLWTGRVIGSRPLVINISGCPRTCIPVSLSRVYKFVNCRIFVCRIPDIAIYAKYCQIIWHCRISSTSLFKFLLLLVPWLMHEKSSYKKLTWWTTCLQWCSVLTGAGLRMGKMSTSVFLALRNDRATSHSP